MALTFYYGSGSPYAWMVWLALEHKRIPYDFKLLSFDAGDTKTPEFLKVNPRAQVPAVLHDGYAVFESAAICEYLEESFPQSPLLPKDARARATVRRLVLEAQHQMPKAGEELMEQTLYRPKDQPEDPAKIAAAMDKMAAELARWEGYLTQGTGGLKGGDYLAGAVSLADFALYPFVRILRRLQHRMPHVKAGDRVPKGLQAWMGRIEAAPYYEKTVPPHWKG
jgi:glutathione S-transferase